MANKESEMEQNTARLTREQLSELEKKEKTAIEKTADFIVVLLPLVCCGIAAAEYLKVPDNSLNRNPEYYIILLAGLGIAYLIFMLAGIIYLKAGNDRLYERVRFKAPLCSGFFLLLTAYDWLTLKTGIFTQPFVPCMNFIIRAAWMDRNMLLVCTLHTLRLLFIGYFTGIALGLVTGITCGYSKKCRYWVDPVIKFLGPIPTSTWIPIMMVVATSLFAGSVFIIALGSWFAVTVATMTGISNVDNDYFEAAKTLGAKGRQLVFRIAIPHAMPSIFQGCTQAMSSSCVAIMIAEMMGVKAGLGWYMTWAKSWASYDKMFAALFVICFIFTIVTKSLDIIKWHQLRWQNGGRQ